MPKRRMFKKTARKPRVSKAVKNYVKKEIEVMKETKMFDTHDASTIQVGGSVINMFTPAAGDSAFNVLGNQVNLHEYEINASIQPPAITGVGVTGSVGPFGATGSGFSNCRAIVFMDHMNDGIDTPVDIILASDQQSQLPPTWNSGYNQNSINEKRITILKDSVFQIHPTLYNGTGVSPFYDDKSTHVFKWKKKLRSKADFTDASGSLVPTKNYLGLLLIGDAQTSSTAPLFDYRTTVRFTDA